MDYLMVVNTILVGGMFAIWTKKDLLNFVIKMGFLVALIANILRLSGKL